MKDDFIPKPLNNPLAFWSLINLFFCYHTPHILIKTLVSLYFTLQPLAFPFSFFSILRTILQHCLINRLIIIFIVSSCSFYKLFTETNSSWLMYKSIKALGIYTFVILNFKFSLTILFDHASFSFSWLLTYFNSCSYCTKL